MILKVVSSSYRVLKNVVIHTPVHSSGIEYFLSLPPENVMAVMFILLNYFVRVVVSVVHQGN